MGFKARKKKTEIFLHRLIPCNTIQKRCDPYVGRGHALDRYSDFLPTTVEIDSDCIYKFDFITLRWRLDGEIEPEYIVRAVKNGF